LRAAPSRPRSDNSSFGFSDPASSFYHKNHFDDQGCQSPAVKKEATESATHKYSNKGNGEGYSDVNINASSSEEDDPLKEEVDDSSSDEEEKSDDSSSDEEEESDDSSSDEEEEEERTADNFKSWEGTVNPKRSCPRGAIDPKSKHFFDKHGLEWRDYSKYCAAKAILNQARLVEVAKAWESVNNAKKKKLKKKTSVDKPKPPATKKRSKRGNKV